MIIMVEKKFRRIGVLTSGGDSPGMNAAIRSVVRSADKRGVEVMGIYGGNRGLIDNDMKLLHPRDVSNILSLGGTMLYSDRCLEFKTEEGMQKALKTAADNKIDGLVTIGGDGTFRGAQDITRRGLPCIGLPGTIDNDISSTDYTIGFDTAMNTVVDMVDRLRDTCESHARCNVVEVMGNKAGYIALQTGVAVGATGVALMEIPFDEEACIEKIKASRAAGKRNFIVLVSEGLGHEDGEEHAKRIEEKSGVETRFARLAHVQRGGRPTLRDRLVASLMGDYAVDLLLEGKSNLVVCLNDNKVCAHDIEWALMYDRVYKGKATEEELASLAPDVRENMQKLAAAKHAAFKNIYDVANDINI